MKTTLGKFLNAVRAAVAAAGFEYPTVVFVGEDPDDGTERVEIRMFDVPQEIRWDVQTSLIQILLDTEDRLPGVDSIAFAHSPDLDAASRELIMSWARGSAARS